MKKLAVLSLLAVPGLALAHPGPHAGDLFALLLHLATAHDHLLLPLLVTALGLGGAWLVKPVLADSLSAPERPHDSR